MYGQMPVTAAFERLVAKNEFCIANCTGKRRNNEKRADVKAKATVNAALLPVAPTGRSCSGTLLLVGEQRSHDARHGSIVGLCDTQLQWHSHVGNDRPSLGLKPSQHAMSHLSILTENEP